MNQRLPSPRAESISVDLRIAMRDLSVDIARDLRVSMKSLHAQPRMLRLACVLLAQFLRSHFLISLLCEFSAFASCRQSYSRASLGAFHFKSARTCKPPTFYQGSHCAVSTVENGIQNSLRTGRGLLRSAAWRVSRRDAKPTLSTCYLDASVLRDTRL